MWTIVEINFNNLLTRAIATYVQLVWDEFIKIKRGNLPLEMYSRKKLLISFTFYIYCTYQITRKLIKIGIKHAKNFSFILF